MKKQCLIIAEAGVNHNGNLELAFQLCNEAKKAGADIIKFQTWKTEAIITQTTRAADYQTQNTGIEETQYEMLKRLELSYNDFRKIKNYCDEIGIIFSSTADEIDSLDFLISLGIPFIKIGSGEINNIPFLRYVGTQKLPIILSTGMSSLADIDNSIQAINSCGYHNDITLLHCTTDYPCSYSDVNLKAMLTIGNAFHLPFGYSDHTLGTTVAIAAVSLGATVIEKHFTLDKNMDGPDHKASITPNELAQLVQDIRNTELILGTGTKEPSTNEKTISNLIQKKIVAKVPIPKGHTINSDMICTKRNNIGISSKYWDLIVGSISPRDYNIDEPIIFPDKEKF